MTNNLILLAERMIRPVLTRPGFLPLVGLSPNLSVVAAARQSAATLTWNLVTTLMKTIRHPQLLILTLLTLLAATVPAPAGLVHQWTFNDGTANDSAGTTHGTLYNGATISGGQLQLDGVNDYFRTGPLAESLSNRTLMVWVTLSNLTQRGGSALTLEDPTGADRFDGIVYGEQVANRWINGSDNARRWNTPAGTTASPVETSLGRVSIAIVYGDPGSSDNNIKIYRNGALYADYTPAYPRTNYPAGVADVLIGVRHSDRAGDTGTAGGSDAFLAGSIDEARIYDTALTASEIAGITSAVLNTNDSGPGSLRQAIAEAVSGDTITFHPTLSGQTLTLTSGQLFLEKNLTIDASALPGGITLNGNGASRILSVGLGVTASLDSLTVTNGFSTGSGGGIYNVGNLTVSRCTVAGNQAAGYGGGILNLASDSALIVNNSTIVGNIANDSIFGGGGIMNFGSLSVNSSTLVGNSAPNRDAGGIFIYAGGVSLTNSIIAGNTQLSGGSIREYNTNYAGAFNLVDVNPLLTPLGHYGGPTPTMVPLPGSPAINTGGATTLLTDQRGSPRVVGPATDRGAVEVQPLVVLNTNDSGPYALRTAVASASGGDTITFTAPLSGQTITLTSGQLLINKNLTIDASALPAGITLDGNHSSRLFECASGTTNTLTALTLVHGNAAGVFPANTGGGLLNQGNLTLNRCTLANNQAGATGGGIQNFATLTLNQCTLWGNAQVVNGGNGGGGIANQGTLVVNQSTFTANHADNASIGGGGILNLDTLTLNNSIVARNSSMAGADISHRGDSLARVGANIIMEYHHSAFAPSTGPAAITNAPLLAPLGNYGGPTPTMPPLPGSPAIDTGGATTLLTDQRGFARVVGSTVDIGAVETGNAIPGATVVTVNTDTVSGFDNDEVSLREAVIFSGPDATITFAPTLASQTITLTNGQLSLDRNLTIDASALPDGITVHGNNASRIFRVSSGVTAALDQLTLTGGSADNGGAIHNAGSLTVTNCMLTNNVVSARGGAIYTTGPVFNCVDSMFGWNTSSNSAGAIWYIGPTGALTRCTFEGNRALGANSDAGAVYGGARLNLEQCSFSGNSAGRFGGALYSMSNPFFPTVLRGCTLSSNAALSGGGIYNASGLLTLTNCTLTGNLASGTALSIHGGGGIFNMGLLSLTNCALAGNLASSVGGGALNTTGPGSSVTLVGCVFSTNQNTGFGGGFGSGGIYANNSTMLNCLDSTFIGNTSSNSAGAIQVTGGATGMVARCTFESNMAFGNGFGDAGAVRNNNATLALEQCTLNGNAAGRTGGALDLAGSHSTVLRQCTIAGNTSFFEGGGIRFLSGTLTADNCVIAGNIAINGNGEDVFQGAGTLVRAGASVIGIKTSISTTYPAGTPNGNGDYVGTAAVPVNPLLAPLGNYGGLTRTMPPLPGSPAIDAGGATTLLTDQRGLPRVSGGAVDIGAVEVQVVPGVNPPALVNPVWSRAGEIETFAFAFTNVPNADFSVVTTTNVALPLSGWTPISYAVEVPAGSGQYQFIDTPAPNEPQRFYGVASP